MTLAIFAVVFLITGALDIPFSDLTRDAAATLEGPWYTGALSNLVVVVSSIGAGIALFAGGLLRSGHGPSPRGLLNALGIMMLAISADDLLLLHESVLPSLGLSDGLVYVIYVVALAAILWVWRRVILGSTDWIFLLLAASAMGVSVIVDILILDQRIFDLPFAGELIEDPAKILGMVFMAFYLIVTARVSILEPEPDSHVRVRG